MKDLVDSGKRREFASGAVRDVNEDKGRFDLICPFAMTVLAKVLQKGCKKYGERNWEKGIPQSSYIDSAIRHLTKHLMGRRDEDHLAAALYNVHCLVSQRERIAAGLLPESLDDLPKYEVNANPLSTIPSALSDALDQQFREQVAESIRQMKPLHEIVGKPYDPFKTRDMFKHQILCGTGEQHAKHNAANGIGMGKVISLDAVRLAKTKVADSSAT